MLNKDISKALIAAFFATATLSVGAAAKYSANDDSDATSPWHTKAGCGAGGDGTYLFVTMENIRNDEGNLRAQIYSDKADEFLEKGKWLKRIEIKTIRDENTEQRMCIELPSAGEFALAILHDRNANGKLEVFTEGFGFSRNPKLGFGAPDHDEVVYKAKKGVNTLKVTMSYLIGADEEKVDRRRRSKRR